MCIRDRYLKWLRYRRCTRFDLRAQQPNAELFAYELARWRAQSSAHRFLPERADPRLFGGGQLLQREGYGPHGTFVEARLVAEAERRVPRVELLRALEEADDLAVLGIGGHPVPEFRREGWGAGFDDRMEPLAHGAIRSRHRFDRREHGAFPVRLVRAWVGFFLIESCFFLCFFHKSPLNCFRRIHHVLSLINVVRGG